MLHEAGQWGKSRTMRQKYIKTLKAWATLDGPVLRSSAKGLLYIELNNNVLIILDTWTKNVFIYKGELNRVKNRKFYFLDTWTDEWKKSGTVKKGIPDPASQVSLQLTSLSLEELLQEALLDSTLKFYLKVLKTVNKAKELPDVK